MRYAITLALAVLLAADVAMPRPAWAQDADTERAWHLVAARLDAGRQVQLRLRNGQRFAATLLHADDRAMVVVPKTRLAVPPQPVSYADIVSLEVRDPGRTGAGKAIAIGVATGAAAFLGILLVTLATID